MMFIFFADSRTYSIFRGSMYDEDDVNVLRLRFTCDERGLNRVIMKIREYDPTQNLNVSSVASLWWAEAATQIHKRLFFRFRPCLTLPMLVYTKCSRWIWYWETRCCSDDEDYPRRNGVALSGHSRIKSVNVLSARKNGGSECQSDEQWPSGRRNQL